jgi:SAM-dependent methyltransferase
MTLRLINKIIRKFNLSIEKSTSPITLSLNDIAEEPYNKAPFSGRGLKKFIEDFEFNTVLDIGAGQGIHSEILLNAKKHVTSLDFGTSVYFKKNSNHHETIKCDYLDYNFKEQFDAIWASHVLEHQPNPNTFLKKIHKDLKENGVLCITVPPLKHEIVGGHLSLWNAGLLMYHLVFAGFNCKNISILTYGYNISIILKKETISTFPSLSFDKGDIELLLNYFPDNTKEPFNGDIKELNW